MPPMKRRLASAAAATAVAAATFGLVPATPAAAYPQCAAGTMCGIHYYADAARTQLQGGHTTNCEGSVLDWGIRSGYSVSFSQPCNGGPIEV